jgi:hypothetical protein
VGFCLLSYLPHLYTVLYCSRRENKTPSLFKVTNKQILLHSILFAQILSPHRQDTARIIVHLTGTVARMVSVYAIFGDVIVKAVVALGGGGSMRL